MRLYEGTIGDFNRAVIQNKIADQIDSSYLRYYKRRAAPSEYRSWQQSLNFLKNSFDYTGLTDNKLVIEYELPYSTRRIDALNIGCDSTDTDSVVLIELKQWSNDNVAYCESDGNVVVDYGSAKEGTSAPFNSGSRLSLRPEGLSYSLSGSPPPTLASCAYCHNYSRGWDLITVIFFPKFVKYEPVFPVFAKRGHRGIRRLPGRTGCREATDLKFSVASLTAQFGPRKDYLDTQET